MGRQADTLTAILCLVAMAQSFVWMIVAVERDQLRWLIPGPIIFALLAYYDLVIRGTGG
jgi:hypothetical protein